MLSLMHVTGLDVKNPAGSNSLEYEKILLEYKTVTYISRNTRKLLKIGKSDQEGFGRMVKTYN